jgi:hypothetical protein
MANVRVTVTVDGRDVPESEILALHLERAKKTLAKMLELGGPPTLLGVAITERDIDEFDLQRAKDALRETKQRLGNDGLVAIYAKELRKTDQMWREIAAASPSDVDLQPSTAEITADGLTMGKFMAAFYKMTKGDRAMFFDIHPEHFITESPRLTEATCMEVFGMYGGPTYMALTARRRGHGYEPIPIDADTSVAMVADCRLMSDGTPMKMIGLHQFKVTPRGILLKAGVFLPAAAPKEIVEGHKLHLAVEMFNGMKFAGETKTAITPFLIDTVLRFKKF